MAKPKYPHVPPPRTKPWRTSALDGKKYGGGHTGKLDTLANWEGYRVFRDPRSATGWVDLKNRVTAAVDTHGSALHPTKDGKLAYAKPGPTGGLGGALGKALKVVMPAFHALELHEEVTGTLFGDEIAEQLQAIAKPVASVLLPGAGELVGYAQTAQRLGESLAFGDGGGIPDPSFRVDLAGGGVVDTPADAWPSTKALVLAGLVMVLVIAGQR